MKNLFPPQDAVREFDEQNDTPPIDSDVPTPSQSHQPSDGQTDAQFQSNATSQPRPSSKHLNGDIGTEFDSDSDSIVARGNFSPELNRVRIVAIGASAGGLEALERTLASIPSRLDVAFVVLQHLSPDHESHLGELLSRKTSLPIETAKTDVAPKANHIYLIPRDAELEILAGRFVLHQRDPNSKRLRSIDRFMESLAVDRAHHSVAVVLSGTGSDGTIGAQAIHAVDGLVIAQTPDSAAFDGMPTSLIRSGCVDLILDPEAIGSTLADYGSCNLSASDFAIQMFLDADQVNVLNELNESAAQTLEVELSRFRAAKVFRAAASVLGGAERFTIGDVVDPQLFANDSQSLLLPLLDYTKLISSIREEIVDDSEMLVQFHEALLRCVKDQLQEPGYLNFLGKRVIPQAVRQSRESRSIRCWIPASKDPLEACLLSAMLQRECEVRKCDPEIKIFVTRKKIAVPPRDDWWSFDAERFRGIDENLWKANFTRCADKIQLNEVCRSHIQWVDFDIFDEEVPAELDVVIVRGLLTLLKADSQRLAISKLAQSTRLKGFICLGDGETVNIASRNFVQLDRRFRLYRKVFDYREKFTSARETPAGTDGRVIKTMAGPHSKGFGVGAQISSITHTNATMSKAYDKAFQFLETPGFVVTDTLELIHSFGGGNGWLTVGAGTYSNLILDMCPKPLADILPGAVSRALHLQDDIEVPDVKLPLIATDSLIPPTGSGDVTYGLFRLIVSPLATRTKPCYALILLKNEADSVFTQAASIDDANGEAMANAENGNADVSAARTALSGSGDRNFSDTAKRLAEVERELSQTKRHLRSTVLALETSNEELQATNEELTASNEEMQSSNEELQSINEEVISVNEEMHGKVAELRESYDDMDNLLRSAEIAVIYLDHELCVRRFTPRAANYFRLQPEDVGRPLDHFRNYLNYDLILEDCRNVLETDVPSDTEIRDEQGNYLLLRLLPYRQAEQTTGVVIAILEIGRAKQAEFKARRLRAIIASSPDAIVGLSPAGLIETWNRGAVNMYGYEEEEIIGRPYEKLALDDSVRFADLATLTTTDSATPFQTKHRRSDGSMFHASIAASRYSMDDESDKLAISVRDISAQVQAEKLVREAVARRDQFLAVLSHELRNPLNAISAASQIMRKETEHPHRALSVINRQIVHAVRLLDDLLDISRITRGELNLQMDLVDLTEICRDAVDSMTNLFEQKHQTIDTQMPDQPLILNADRERLLQTLDNLLSNATKYTPEGGHVELIVRRVDVDGQPSAQITVRDDGVGISEQEYDSIFKLFSQSNDDVDGLGIGLALVKGITDSHGGTVEVFSEGLNQGTCFKITLPISAELTTLHRVERNHEDPALIENALRIVLVEDGDDNRSLLTDLLQLDGHEVHGFASGRAGLQAILDLKPDVAMTDVGLPDISGLDIAREVRRHFNRDQIYLIAVTGLGLAADRARVSDAGFDEHVVKPIDMSRLRTILSRRKS